MNSRFKMLRSSSALSGANANFLEDLYEQYLQSPQSVAEAWRAHFEQLAAQTADQPADQLHAPVRARFAAQTKNRRKSSLGTQQQLSALAAEKQAAVLRLINAYRVRGHQHAALDPLQLHIPPAVDDLRPDYHNLTDTDMDSVFNTGSLYAPEQMKLQDILDFVRKVYCGTVGSEYMHITATDEKRWIQKRLEGYQARPEIEAEGKRWLLTLLTAAEGIEKYLHSRYVGQKRFSLEGGESLIPLLDELIQRAGVRTMQEIVIGMAHRGRLNVLTNILGKPPTDIFDEFEGKTLLRANISSGDVKYHMGFSTDIDTPGGMLHVALGFNPSHLEIISPVIEGSVRARQQRRGDIHGDRVLPILIHGDAAFAGQGVVMETLQLSQARGFSTGGTVHIVVNNQIGFTTINPMDSRSTAYCTDVAKMVQAPIFHVNGDDPEAVIFVTRLALDYRMQFHKDVIIDLVCYRRHGHNEADEPAVTQPYMYQKIRQHATVRTLYAEKLLSEGIADADFSEALVDNYRSSIEHGRVVSRPVSCGLENPYAVNWSLYQCNLQKQSVKTQISQQKIELLGSAICTLPDGFELHPRVEKIMQARHKMTQGNQQYDWGFCETLAYASLVDQGIPVRLSGQDSARGTFFHRHAVLHNQINNKIYTPLQHVSKKQAHFVVIDSLLSEEAVLAYEYGYATAEPNSLNLWEAQFGDFANGAQVVIDQFISSAEAKWGLHCGLVMLLPHGYEGQGPEHSSARLERYMQLCSEHNMQVCVPTLPAQMFHLLRRQVLGSCRKPLIILTPKSLLRHKLAVSVQADLSEQGFQAIIDETDALEANQIKRIVICTGKVYFDLLETRRARSMQDVAIIRIEQLYPFPKKIFAETLQQYPQAETLIWCQEEPQNQGAWDQIKYRFHGQIEQGKKVYYVGRKSAAAAATGFHTLHIYQLQKLVEDALEGRIDSSMNRGIQACP
ncbi:MAG: 2-oxoglutarate dehydrogenase E1 component [gamma proteobacterium symbiont of Bathyaustriella thionipta]|nr:2-oxoglutarate dehydrogenase E1 component [gamma proteobacterium symbiont of Bathyaustriella thionipta]